MKNIPKMICQLFEGPVIKHEFLLQLKIYTVATVQHYCAVADNLFKSHSLK